MSDDILTIEKLRKIKQLLKREPPTYFDYSFNSEKKLEETLEETLEERLEKSKKMIKKWERE